MIKPKEFDEDIIDAVVSMYTSDIKISAIGKHLCMSDANVKRCLNKRNILLKGNMFASLKYKHLNNILDKDYVIEKYNTLYSIKEIACHFECGVNLIQSVFKLHNIKSRKFHEIRELQLKKERDIPATDENIIKDYIENYNTLHELIQKYHISSTTLYKILDRNNIDKNRDLALIYNKNENKHILSDKICLEKIRNEYDNLNDAALFIGCDPTVLQNRLDKFNIPKFNKSESRINHMKHKIEENLTDYSIIEYDSGSFILKHNECQKNFELSHSSVNQYSNKIRSLSTLCPYCNDRRSISSAEKTIADILESYGLSILRNNKSILGNRELDIYIKDKNLAIEYCGLYWHSNLYKDKKYHLDKMNKCKEKGIRLITIFEDEWLNKSELVLKKLKHILGLSSERIYARKCQIIKIDSKTRNDFLELNHIQGKDKASYSYGLTYNDSVIAVASFSKLNIAKGGIHEDNVFELSRYATSINVVGGLGKLLKKFENDVNPSKLITYADKRWSLGNLYETLGFTKLKDSKPNYWYIDNRFKYRLHRFNYRKSTLKIKYPDNYSDELTELEITTSLNIKHIWDCGNMKYIKLYEKGA